MANEIISTAVIITSKVFWVNELLLGRSKGRKTKN